MGQASHGRQQQGRPDRFMTDSHLFPATVENAPFSLSLLDTESKFMVIFPTEIDNWFYHYSGEHMNAPAPMIRLTTQRQIILEELAKVKTHPTASELYDMVRKRLPRIGLGTVYRNLELMADSGMILKIEVGGTQKRFDATTDDHYHIRCSVCGRVDDIDVPVIRDLASQAATTTSYQILGHHIEFTGICSSCQKEGRSRTAAL
jgi:Fur family ferric uptake transcriptional regulator